MRVLLRFAFGLALMLAAGGARADFPASTYPDCAEDGTLSSCPPDMIDGNGEWRGITWSFTSFINPDYKRHVRREEWALGSGNWFDRASAVTMGRYDVPIAVVDSGVRWYKSSFVPKTQLNRGEVPQPRSGSTPCAAWDCNGDGWFTVVDYATDARVSITAGTDEADDQLDPSDLIAIFSDGVDSDSNGYKDDIAGWDFMWNDNDPRASNDFYHGSAVMTDAAATAGELGSDLGYCPNCAILPVRVSDSFIGEANKIAQGVIYAVDRGAKVIGIAMGSITNSDYLKAAFEYAWANGVLVVVAIGDEMSYHHLPPGVNDFALAVHSIKHYPFIGAEQARSFLGYNGCNNYGAHLTLVAATNDCATGSVAIISGVAGMVYSRGRELGLELSADEVRSILTQTADDIDVPESRVTSTPYFPSHPGWDQFFGYGRVNTFRAVEAVAEGHIPPEVHLLSPRWYERIDPRTTPSIAVEVWMDAPRADFYDWELAWAPGADARDRDFRLLDTGTETGSRSGLFYTWRVSDIPAQLLDPAAPMEAITTDDPLLDKLQRVNAKAITLRLSATDARGNRSEMRKTFFLHEDPDLASGFPVDIGPGDSSPVLADLDGDGLDDIVVGTSDGRVVALRGDGRALPGWPVQVGPQPGFDVTTGQGHLGAPPYASGVVVPARQGILGTVAVADLDADGRKEVLASTLDGQLFVFDALGRLRQGFPVARDAVSDAQTSELVQYDPGFAAGPVPADLDGDGDLEIVLPAMDQKLYVWDHDGSRHPGFPVVLAFEDTEVHNRGRIFSTPAVGDLDGDGDPEILVGSNEYDPERFWLNYVYAVHHDGDLHEGGPILPRWPVELIGILSSVVRYMGEGVTMSPVMADIDGDGAEEVAFAAPGWCPVILNARGNIVTEMACDASGWGAGAGSDEALGATYLANVTFGDLTGDGRPELVGGITGVNWALGLVLSRWVPFQDHLVLAWDTRTGDALDGWPQVIEDIMMFVAPAIGDVSGDGVPDVVMSSGGYNVHAWTAEGEEIDGWPHFTGGWVYSAIRVGDVTGDDLQEVVAVTRAGQLHVWETPGVEDVPNGKGGGGERGQQARATRW